MAGYDDDLLKIANRLLSRKSGQRGKLPSARIRRSVSTSYYAVFHFLIEYAGKRIAGSPHELLRRRRAFARSFDHKGIKAALDKVREKTTETSVSEFLHSGSDETPRPTPAFAQQMAKAFADAQAKRHDADYDLNKPLSETDARALIRSVRRAIDAWRNAKTPKDRDFKHALCLFMLLKERLRQES